MKPADDPFALSYGGKAIAGAAAAPAAEKALSGRSLICDWICLHVRHVLRRR